MQGVAFDKAAPDEIKFIVDAWVRSFRDSPWAGCIGNDKYQEVMRERVNGLLARGVQCTVAFPDIVGEGPRRLLGFVATEQPDLLHYIYVKRGARRMGLASRLIEEYAPHRGRFTFRTPASDMLFRRGYVWTPVPARLVDLNESH